MKWFADVGLVALMVVALAFTPSNASCGGGSCSGQSYGPPVLYTPAPEYKWVAFPDDDSQVALMYGNQQVGGYSFKQGKYQEYSSFTRSWGQLTDKAPYPIPADLAAKYAEQHPGASKKKCPCYPCSSDNCKKDCPCQKTGKPCEDKECTCKDGFQSFPVPPTGVETDKIVEGQTVVNGKHCENCKAFEALETSLPDDSGKCFITIIDADDSRRLTERSFVEQQAPGKFEIQDINPGKPMESWMLDCGFKKPVDNGTTVYAQAPNGKVIWRADKFDQKQLTVALRKTDPNYDPRKDPDLNPHATPMPEPDPLIPAPTPAPQFPLNKLAIVGGILGGVYLMFKKKEGK